MQRRVFCAMAPTARPAPREITTAACFAPGPLQEVGAFCQSHGLWFIVDAAQTAGVFPIDMEAMQIDVLCFTGHKGLMGPQGIGGMIIRDKAAAAIRPLISGGTGSISHLEEVPDFLPDRLEPGTPNLPGIAGLHASLEYIRRIGIDTIRIHEQALTERFLSAVTKMEHVRLFGKPTSEDRTGVVSIQIKGLDSAQAAFRLEQEYGIMTRVGLHCAPNAHKTIGSYPEGTIRFSFGFFNTEEDVDAAIVALQHFSST